MGEVRASSGVGVNARRALWGRSLVFTGTLGTNASEQRRGRLLCVRLAGGAGRALVRRRRGAIDRRVATRIRTVRRGRSGSRGTGPGASASLIRLGSASVRRSIGMNKAASLSVGARSRKPEGLNRRR